MPGDEGNIVCRASSRSVLTETLSVECPICGQDVPETGINLHLDLQCAGQGGPSSSAVAAASPRQPTWFDDWTSLHSSTPVRQTAVRQVSGSRGGPVASIFTPSSSRTKAKTESPDPVLVEEDGGNAGRGVKRTTQSNATNGNAEKKPRINALTANQP